MTVDLAILSILETLGDEYVVLRKSNEFPAFTQGSDIDILVVDRTIASEKIQKYLLGILDGRQEFLRVLEGRGHIHLDVIRAGRLLVRLDLVDSFDFFTRFSVQDSLKIKILLTRAVIRFDRTNVYVPSSEFDLLIRYLEYLEWFERRPDKIKHLDYILANSSEEQRAQLVADLHRYVRLHHPTWPGVLPSRNPIRLAWKLITRLYSKFSRIIRSA